MLRLRDIGIKPKLIGLFIAVGLLPLALTSGWINHYASERLLEQTYAQLESVRDTHQDQLRLFFNERRHDVKALGQTIGVIVHNALIYREVQHQLTQRRIEDFFRQHTRALQQISADAEARQALTEAINGAWQGDSLAWLKDWAESQAFSELLLTDARGNIRFAWREDGLQGQNVEQSPDLKEVHQAGLQATYWRDFAPRGEQDYRAWAATPLRDSQTATPAGVLIAGLSKQPLNQLLQQRVAMGQTGEIYLAAREDDGSYVFRSDLTTMSDEYVAGYDLTARAPEYVKHVLEEKRGFSDTFVDSAGNPVLVVAGMLDLPGFDWDWALISKIDLEEVVIHRHLGEEQDFLSRYAELYDYEDLLLINQNGHVFYSVARAADYHTNLVEGPYRDTHLGRLINEVLRDGKPGMSDFQLYPPADNQPAFFLAQPIKLGHHGHEDKQEQTTASLVVAARVSLREINTIMSQSSGLGETGESYLVGEDYRMRSDSRLDPLGHSVEASLAGNVAENGANTEAVRAALGGQTGTREIQDYLGNRVLSAFTPVQLDGITWALLAEINVAEVYQPVRNLLYFILFLALGLLLAVVIAAYWLAESLSRPLKKTLKVTQALGRGQLDQKVRGEGRDEIGQMLNALNDTLQRLISVLRQVGRNAESLATNAEQVNATSLSLSQNASEQASSTEQTGSALQQLTASINQNMQGVQSLNQAAAQSMEKAEWSGAKVMGTLEAMRRIAERISLVEEVAHKTNLLALNAAIEAARVGSHGRGFTVVATEIRKLAQHSQEAAEEIRALVDQSVSFADEAGNSLQELLPQIQRVSEQMEHITQTYQEQVGGVEQINTAMRQLDQVSQQNASSAEELAVASENLNEQAETLSELLSFFQLPEQTENRKN